jgi:hypothetical protein
MDLHNNVHILEIAKILKNINERIEGNLVCDIDPYNFVINNNILKIKNLQYLSKNKTKICEIGVNACHSLLIMIIENPNAEYLLFDLNYHKYTEPCINYIKSQFPNTKITIIYGNSIETVNNYINKHQYELNSYDLCHIDGGHTEDIFLHDYNNINKLSKKNTPIIFDDYNLYDIKQFINKKLNMNEIEKYNDINIHETDLHFIYKYT